MKSKAMQKAAALARKKLAPTSAKSKKDPLPKSWRESISTLIKDAMNHGLQQEYGTGSSVDAAELSCGLAVTALETKLVRLLNSEKRLKEENRWLKSWIQCRQRSDNP